MHFHTADLIAPLPFSNTHTHSKTSCLIDEGSSSRTNWLNYSWFCLFCFQNKIQKNSNIWKLQLFKNIVFSEKRSLRVIPYFVISCLEMCLLFLSAKPEGGWVCWVKSFLLTPILQFTSWPCILLQLCESKQQKVIVLPCLPQTQLKKVLTQR